MSIEQGAALLNGGRFHEAMAAFRNALLHDPQSTEARLGLSRACIGAGDLHTATAWLSDACRVAPAHLQSHRLLAELLLGQKHYEQALQVYERAYGELQARDRATLLHYGFCLEQANRLDDAVARYREAIAQEPGFLEAHVDLAGVLWRLSDFDGALAHARKAVELGPQHPYAVRVLGTALLNVNQLEEAESALRQSLQLKPGFALAELDLSFVLLLAGRLQEGWAWYEKRWNDADRLKRPLFFQQATEWKGPRLQPLEGKRIAVYAEQGLGDVIQFLRYVPMLQQDGATVFCVIQPPLVPLVEHSLPGVQCLTPDRTIEADMHAALLELPMHYGTTLENIPAAVPYLRAPQEKVRQWRDKLSGWDGKYKVGIAWSGFQGQVNNLNRAIALREWRGLLAMEGVQCFSLQKGDAGRFTDITPEQGQLVDFTAQWDDFTDSAAMLENLDLVISVDTAIVHLAGALGRPVWTLLAPNADWRWLLEREDSPWYPTMRLFRRGFGQKRAGQMERVVEALKTEIGKRG